LRRGADTVLQSIDWKSKAAGGTLLAFGVWRRTCASTQTGSSSARIRRHEADVQSLT